MRASTSRGQMSSDRAGAMPIKHVVLQLLILGGERAFWS